MTRGAYNAVLTGAFACASPYLLISALFNLHGMRQRLSMAVYAALNGKKSPFWFHAASMGEVVVLAPMVKELVRRYPDTPVVITTVTATGQDRCREMIPEATLITLLPLDVPAVINRFIRKINPSHLFIAETELWPNLICGVKKRGAKVLLINGKISRKSTGRYLLAGRLIRETMQSIDFFGLQRSDDLNRFTTLGASPDSLYVIGNIKFDLTLFVNLEGIDRHTVRNSLHLDEQTPVLIAGSTRPGEEPVITAAAIKLLKDRPDLVTILVPRHLKRLGEVEQLLDSARLSWTKHSQLQPGTVIPQVILVDTMGELLALYAAADIAFVGGSLVDFGGHNPLEPALFSTPVLFGTHMRNNAASASRLLDADGAREVTDATSLAAAAGEWFANSEQRLKAGNNAHKVIESNSGMVKRYISKMNELSLLP